MRARELLGQLTTPRRFDPADLQAGLLRFTLGFFKKAVVADNLALQIVDPVFADPARYDTVTVLIAMLAYAAQIYADFSGYTDMALGCARVLGYTLPENFRYPYLARSISEFWSRWHMTMSRFFRDYVYISLGGNRRGPVRASGNALFTTMLSGLWHGASWTYVVWGALHGVGTIIGNLLEAVGLRRDRPWASPVARRLLATLAWCATFLWVVALWVVFRAHDFDDAIIMLRRATSWQGGERLSVDGLVVFGILAVASEHVFGAWREAQGAAAAAVPALLRGAFYAALVVLIVNLKPENPNPFIYFQF